MGNHSGKSSKTENLLVRGATGVAALVTIGAGVNIVFPFFTPEVGQIIFSVLNLIPLIIFCISTKATRQEFTEDPKSKHNYFNLLGGPFKEDSLNPVTVADQNLERVNLLVEQLHTNITRYAFFLIIVYVLYILDNELWFENHMFGGKDYYVYIHSYFNIATGTFNFLSAVFLFLGFKVLYADTISKDGKNTPLPYHKNAAAVSGVFLTVYITFSLVAVITLSLKKHEQPPSSVISEIRNAINSYDAGSNAPATGFIDNAGRIIEASKSENKSAQNTVHEIKRALVSYETATDKPALELIEQINKSIDGYENKAIGNPAELKVVFLNLFQLLIGIFNGLAMALLFGRYVSMEHAVYNMEEGLSDSKKLNHLIHIATIYILPIYALAQPLFGSFDVNVFGDPQIFANGVFFVCWIGKMFFLYLTYLLMKHRLMHLYLHSVVTSHGIPKELAKCFKSDS